MQNLYFPKEQFNNLDDVQLIKMAKNGDKKALNYLLSKYTEIVNMKVGKYFIIGAEREDIMQEGLIGLLKQLNVLTQTNKVLSKHLLIYALKDNYKQQ